MPESVAAVQVRLIWVALNGDAVRTPSVGAVVSSVIVALYGADEVPTASWNITETVLRPSLEERAHAAFVVANASAVDQMLPSLENCIWLQPLPLPLLQVRSRFTAVLLV